MQRRPLSPVDRAPLLALALTPFLVCCASPEPKPDPQPQVESRHKAVDPFADDDGIQDGLQVSGTLGTMDPDDVEQGVHTRIDRVSDCFDRHARNAPYVGGEVRLAFRVARNGTVKVVRVARSEVGAYEVERCIKEEMRRVIFARPKGGEAEFTFPLILPARSPVTTWDAAMVKGELDKSTDLLLASGEGESATLLVPPRGLTLTFYLDRTGQVLSAGMHAEEEIPEAFARQLVENLKRLKLTAPDTSYVKVTHVF